MLLTAFLPAINFGVFIYEEPAIGLKETKCNSKLSTCLTVQPLPSQIKSFRRRMIKSIWVTYLVRVPARTKFQHELN